MKIAIASGKGGTGKTTVSASLAYVWPRPVIPVDLDVEEPNLHLFLHPNLQYRRPAAMEVPVVDESKCTACRMCAELCQFKAISVLGDVLLVFSEMCHGCGGCLAICPEGALSAGQRILGEVCWGKWEGNDFLMGRLRVGEAMSPPLMRVVKDQLDTMITGDNMDVIIDSPPGVSCPAVNAVMDSDVIVLVTEPTPFGHYDLKLAHQAFLPLGIPMAVVVNRAWVGDETVYDFCHEHELPIIAEIPQSREIAETYANGGIAASSSPDLRSLFTTLGQRIEQLAAEDLEAIHA